MVLEKLYFSVWFVNIFVDDRLPHFLVIKHNTTVSTTVIKRNRLNSLSSKKHYLSLQPTFSENNSQ